MPIYPSPGLLTQARPAPILISAVVAGPLTQALVMC
jgi:hypothetical protein